MLQFFCHLGQVIKFNQLALADKQIVFYSEGKPYWAHLGGLVEQLLASGELKLCYISSDKDDPGLALEHANYQSFLIDTGFVRNWLFANMQASIVVMTMSDLHNYQVKRSIHKIHYVYLQHSLVSLHMTYTAHALDHFDTVFCSGQYHQDEVRAAEKLYNLPEKNLVKHGYARVDAILKQAQEISSTASSCDPGAPIHVLLAPSWGEQGLIETIGAQVVNDLLESGFKLTLRPHPETVKHAPDKLEQIVKQHQENKLFNLEVNIVSQDSLHQSDIMLCDWSGVALDYAFGLNKPVIFLDIPKKVFNPEYQKLNIEPFEVSIREKIGTILAMDKLDTLASVIKHTLANYDPVAQQKLATETVYNLGNCDEVGASELTQLLHNL
jgi:hypothetical protein